MSGFNSHTDELHRTELYLSFQGNEFTLFTGTCLRNWTSQLLFDMAIFGAIPQWRCPIFQLVMHITLLHEKVVASLVQHTLKPNWYEYHLNECAYSETFFFYFSQVLLWKNSGDRANEFQFYVKFLVTWHNSSTFSPHASASYYQNQKRILLGNR